MHHALQVSMALHNVKHDEKSALFGQCLVVVNGSWNGNVGEGKSLVWRKRFCFYDVSTLASGVEYICMLTIIGLVHREWKKECGRLGEEDKIYMNEYPLGVQKWEAKKCNCFKTVSFVN